MRWITVWSFETRWSPPPARRYARESPALNTTARPARTTAATSVLAMPRRADELVVQKRSKAASTCCRAARCGASANDARRAASVARLAVAGAGDVLTPSATATSRGDRSWSEPLACQGLW